MKKRKRRLPLMAVALLMFSHSAVTGSAPDKAVVALTAPEMPAAESPSQSSVSAVTPTKRALLVGINNYKYPTSISPLAGSINDVEDIRSVLVGKFDFPPENVLVLKDAQATHAGIISAIQTHLIAKAQREDIVVFQYSGHGSQMKDATGKKISGLDETIVPYDSRDPEGRIFDISGAELHGLLLQLAAKTKNITFILDSCHAGTLVRGAGVRSIRPDTRTPPPPPSYAVGTRGLGIAGETSEPKYTTIAAATSKEDAFEHFTEGKDHGALTYFLTRQLRSAGAGATYRDIMDAVFGNVTANYPAQHPQLEGAEADQHVFGDSSSLAQTYVLTSPLDQLRVSLDIGQVQGATTGSIYEVYEPGTKRFAPPQKPTARVQLTSVDAFTSEGKIVSGTATSFSRAVEREHRYGSSRLLVYFDGLEQSQILQSIKAALEPVKYVAAVPEPGMCNMQVRQAGGRIQTLGADSSTLSTPVAISDAAVVNRVAEQIKSWARWFNVLTIRNAQPEIELRFTLKASQTRDPLARVGKPDAGVLEGETVEATLENASGRDLYVAMLDLSSDGSISVVYPAEQGASEVLKPGLTLSRSFSAFVPPGRSVVTDILKVFASYKPIDLTPLTQRRIRETAARESSEPDPLEELLMDSAGVSRGLAPLLSKPLNLGAWTTTQRVIVVRRKS